MAFNPAIPTPKPIEFKDIKGRHFFVNNAVEEKCKEALRAGQSPSDGFIDFAAAYRNAIRTNKNI